jgi:ELWxxDGT repeat protein
MPRPLDLSLSRLEAREVPAGMQFADIMPGEWGSYPRDITAAGNTLFFSAENRTAGRELWATDGTTAGTRLVKDIVPGRTGSNPTSVLAAGGRVVFTADDGTGRRLWGSDGTAAGTIDLGLKNVGQRFPAGNGVVYVMADDGTGVVLWKTDGTAAGTAKVTGIPDALRVYRTTPPASGTGDILAHFGDGTIGWKGELYFVTQDVATGKLAWAKTNGTGTTPLTDFGGDTSPPQAVTPPVQVVGDRLQFRLQNAAGRPVMWETDGTPAGTRLMKQDVIVSSPATGEVTLAADAGVQVASGRFVYLTNSRNVVAMWAGDGRTPGSFQLLQTFTASGPGWQLYPSLREAGGKAYLFVGPEYSFAPERPSGFWVTDGTTAGTRQVEGVQPTTSDPVKGSFGDKALVKPDFWEREFWLTDGTAAGTSVVPTPPGWINIAWNYVGNLPPDAASPNGYLLFQSYNKVYRTDGTPGGTVIMDWPRYGEFSYNQPFRSWSVGAAGVALDFGNAMNPLGVGRGVLFNGSLFYSGRDTVNRPELWKWDLAPTTPPPPTGTAPKITGTRVNDGSAQRSMVKTLTVTFDSAVTVNPAGVVILNARGTTPAFTQQLSTANGVTTLTITFPNGVGGSIADGRWTLRIDDAAVKSQAGGVKMAADYSFVFTRLYGDTSGDGVYDRETRLLVKQLLGQEVGDPGYRWDLDVNADGRIDGTDELAAIRNWGKVV